MSFLVDILSSVQCSLKIVKALLEEFQKILDRTVKIIIIILKTTLVTHSQFYLYPSNFKIFLINGQWFSPKTRYIAYPHTYT